MTRIAINGFGRVGRQVFKAIWENHQGELNVVAVNDVASPEMSAHLLKHDSTYGEFATDVRLRGGELMVGDWRVRMLTTKDPAELPWKELGVDLVVESTGQFTDGNEARVHIAAGARKVIITAPARNHDLTVVLGVNEKDYAPKKHHVVSNASCTTNCLAPVAKVLHDEFHIEKGFMTTVHAYTNEQRLLDLQHRRDFRRARSAAMNIVPTTTGAAAAIGEVLPNLKGKLHGIALRVPVPAVSIVDLVVVVEKQGLTAKKVNEAFCKWAEGDLKGILRLEEEELVSSDFEGDEHSAIVDAASTMALQDNLVKVLAWYDNEWGYSVRVAELAAYMARKGGRA